jgi:protein-L-isoaspartate O-methyltransferase
MRVLDIGSGSGYLTACFAHLLISASKVSSTASSTESNPSSPSLLVALDHSSVLLELSHQNLQRDPIVRRIVLGHSPEVTLQFVRASALDSSLKWWPMLDGDASRFDVIHVGAAFASLPEHLLPLLRVGGSMLVPVDAAAAANFTSADFISTSRSRSSTAASLSQAGASQQLVLMKLTYRDEVSGDLTFSSRIVHSCSFAPIKEQ